MSTCRKSVFIAVVLLALSTLTGCVIFHDRWIDETHNPGWWGELHLNAILISTQDVLLNGILVTEAAYKNTGYYDSGALFGSEITAEMFKANPGKYWSDLHLLPKGTRFRRVKLQRHFSFEYSDCELSAEILNGEFKGMVVVLSNIGGDPRKKGSLRIGRNDYLRPVD